MPSTAEIRLSEINATLGDLLAELNLVAKLTVIYRGAKIDFEPTDPHFNGAVTLYLHSSILKSENPSWWKSSITMREGKIEKLGETGWMTVGASSKVKELTKVTSENMELLAEALRAYKPYPSERHPQVARGRLFLDAYEGIKDVLAENGINALSCQRVDGVESYTFTDLRGRDWRIGFQGDKQIVHMDGEPIETFSISRKFDLVFFLEKALFEVSYHR